MITIFDLINSLSGYLAAQQQLKQCRQSATDDVEYYCHAYTQDVQAAEQSVAQKLNAYIDQRIAEKIMPPDLLRPTIAPADVGIAA